jgi:hypothetical protein
MPAHRRLIGSVGSDMREDREMAHLRSNKAVRWFAPVALVGAVGLVACGGDSSDSDVSARTAAPAAGVVGSDVHLENQAAEIEAQATAEHLDTQAAAIAATGSDVHLQNQAAEIAAQAQSVSGSDVHLQNQAAEIAEQQAHTQGNAATMSGATQPDDTSDDEFVPGTRRMPVR